MGRKADLPAVAALILVSSTPAFGADRQSISIAPGRLGEAVVALGRQTGASIGMSDQSLAMLPTPAVSGTLSADSALKQLLKGSGAVAHRIDGRSWRILRTKTADLPVLPPTHAAAPPAEQAPVDLIVTASKRDIPLLRYPGMVETVGEGVFVGGEAALGTASLINRVASLSSTHAGTGRNKLFIRAIADSGVAGPTQATTGQYLGDMRLNYAAPDPDLRLYDIGRVEVLEGPQGTLYGAGSLGGVVRIMPNVPNLAEYGGQLSTGVSATQHGNPGGDVSATVNLPIMPETLALRVVGYGVQDGGYIDDVLRGERDVNRVRTWGGRAALRYAPNDDWTIDVGSVYQHIKGDDAQYASRPAGRLKRASSVAEPYSSAYLLGNIRIERQWDSLRFVSSTGYVRHDIAESYDATQPESAPSLFRQDNEIRIFSTENRLVRDLDNGLGWILGAAFLDSSSRINRSLTSFGVVDVFQREVIPGVPLYGMGRPATTTGVRNHIREATLFGEASFEPMAGLIATFGGRLTNSRLSGEALDPIEALSAADVARAEAQADRTETTFLPSVSLLTDALPNLTLYVKFQQGFRPGGLSVDDQRIRRFMNDRVSTFEAGFRKGVPGVDMIALSANLAYSDWDDIQADVTDRIGLPASANIGDGRIYTVEGRIVVRPHRRLSFDGSFIYNDSRLTQPAAFLRTLSYEGNSLSLPNVANLGGRLAIDYRVPVGEAMQAHFSGSARYVGKSRLGVGPILGRTQGDYVDTSLSASLTRGPVQWSLSLSNLFDSDGNRFSLGTPFDLQADHYTPLRPRTVRIGMDFAF